MVENKITDILLSRLSLTFDGRKHQGAHHYLVRHRNIEGHQEGDEETDMAPTFRLQKAAEANWRLYRRRRPAITKDNKISSESYYPYI